MDLESRGVISSYRLSLYGITAGSIQPGENGVVVPMLVTSGQLDSYALPDIDQIIFFVPVWNAQGHTCDFGPHAAGLTIKTRTGKVRIPFVRQQSTMHWLMGFYPPPPYSSLYMTTNGEKDPEISESLPVINLTTSKISSNLVQVVKGLNPPIVGSDSVLESFAASHAANTSSGSSAESLVLAGNLVKKRARLKRRTSSDQGKLRVVKKFRTSKKDKSPKTTSKRDKSQMCDDDSDASSALMDIDHLLDSTLVQHKGTFRGEYEKIHLRYGHVDISSLVYLKRKGIVHSYLIPTSTKIKYLVKDCPVCLAMKYRKPSTPTSKTVVY